MTFLDLQYQVQGIMERGGSLDEAEGLINDERHQVTDDERAALWLWAWSLQPRHAQHHHVLTYFQELERA
jgi:hypothetical protein